jgi:hypothetical protein
MLARGPDGHVGFVFDLINRLANAFGYSGSTEEDSSPDLQQPATPATVQRGLQRLDVIGRSRCRRFDRKSGHRGHDLGGHPPIVLESRLVRLLV